MKNITILLALVGTLAHAGPTVFGSTTASLFVIAGENVSVGEVVATNDSGGSPRVFKADADGVTQLTNPVGFAVLTTSSGSSVPVATTGEISIPDTEWDSVPGTGDVGKRVYLSETAGNLTLTPPATPGSTVIRVGVITRGGSGLVKMSIQVGEGTVL